MFRGDRYARTGPPESTQLLQTESYEVSMLDAFGKTAEKIL